MLAPEVPPELAAVVALELLDTLVVELVFAVVGAAPDDPVPDEAPRALPATPWVAAAGRT